MNIEQISNEALQLDTHSRAMLAEMLWKSLENPYAAFSDISDKEAVRLACQRDDEIEKGKIRPLSHSELMSRLRCGN